MREPIPKTMRAARIEAYTEDLGEALRGLQVADVAVPAPRRGEVLVRIAAAPCNPSDLLFLRGRYGVRKTLPAVPGWEGAGTVVASGGGWLASWLVGKRVACGSQSDRGGTWAELAVARATECIPLRRGLTFEQGATLVVNPLTALGLLDVARRGGHRAAVQTAGASQLGRMLVALARDAGWPLVSVVRRPAQVELLESLGAEHVLDSSEPHFAERLRAACENLRATAAFDAVAGEMTGVLLNAMPRGSVVQVYGGLSDEACAGVDPIELIFRDKTITGFYLGDWLRRRGVLRLLRAAARVQRLVLDGRIATSVERRVGLDDLRAALERSREHATDGKLLIRPGDR